MSENTELICNIFEGNFVFNEPLSVDFFRVEGVAPRNLKFSLLGKVQYQLERIEDTQLAKYFPSEHDDYLIGILKDKPKKTIHIIQNMKITYEGKKPLYPSGSGKRALIELFYNIQRQNLEDSDYWLFGSRTAYPCKWEPLYKKFNCNLNMFRGPHFYYHILANGRVIVTIDTKTHYIHSLPFLHEIQTKGRDLKWFEEEIKNAEEAYKVQRRKIKGIYFHYILEHKSVPINGINPQPISQIQFETIFKGKPWKGTVADFLLLRYPTNRLVSKLDMSQPCICSGIYNYAPQLLLRHITLDEVPRNILNEETHLMDVKSKKIDRDAHYPAHRRWEYIDSYLQNHFKYIDLGKQVIKFSQPITAPVSNHFSKPRLLIGNGVTVEPNNLMTQLGTNGLYKPPEIEHVFLFSIDSSLRIPLWEEVKKYLEDNFKLTMYKEPNITVTTENELENYLKKKRTISGLDKSICLAIIDDQYKAVKRTFGHFDISVQCIRRRNAKNIVEYGRRSLLEGVCAGIIAKSGSIPWLLHDKLNYDYYAAIDVGRQKSEYWAIGVVYNKRGEYKVFPGEMKVGEKLDEEALKKCIPKIKESKPKSLILLRDGNIPLEELKTFSKLIDKSEIENCAVVEIKKNIPHRIFRKHANRIAKPLSGDYIKLDDNLILLCCAGVDEYEHGTPIPKLLEIKLIKGSIDFLKVAQDIFFLTYLNWGSPSHSYSSPAPLRLAHLLASQLSEGIEASGPPF